MKTILIFLAFWLLSSSIPEQTPRGLHHYYKDYFPIGVAVSANSVRGEEGRFIIQHFNSITPENAMKMGPIHPLINKYHWTDADSIVSFGVGNKLKIRGHALCWHEQTPGWIFKDQLGTEVSRDTLLNRLKSHIETVVSRYKGRIYAWDVVNEAIDDDSAKFLRNSAWYRICGEEFITKAFEWAHAADPDALLFYNDYNTERPEKRERIYRLLKKLVDAKVPIHGVGLQGHWSIYEPSGKELQDAIARFASLGLQVQITELDMSIYPWEKEPRPVRPGDQLNYTGEVEKLQSEKYGEMFKIFRENRRFITGVTFWNLSDRHSWLDQYPVPGRKNYPLLFDKDLQPKKAYWEVVRF